MDKKIKEYEIINCSTSDLLNLDFFCFAAHIEKSGQLIGRLEIWDLGNVYILDLYGCNSCYPTIAKLKFSKKTKKKDMIKSGIKKIQEIL